MEEQPSSVPAMSGTKQEGDIRARWTRIEPSVWTIRMLTALERGVKEGVRFSWRDNCWPDDIFAKAGLFSLETARALVVQPPQG